MLGKGRPQRQLSSTSALAAQPHAARGQGMLRASRLGALERSAVSGRPRHGTRSRKFAPVREKNSFPGHECGWWTLCFVSGCVVPVCPVLYNSTQEPADCSNARNVWETQHACGMTSYEGDLSDRLLGPTPDATPLWDDVMLRGLCRTESSRHLSL